MQLTSRLDVEALQWHSAYSSLILCQEATLFTQINRKRIAVTTKSDACEHTRD